MFHFFLLNNCYSYSATTYFNDKYTVTPLKSYGFVHDGSISLFISASREIKNLYLMILNERQDQYYFNVHSNLCQNGKLTHEIHGQNPRYTVKINRSNVIFPYLVYCDQVENNEVIKAQITCIYENPDTALDLRERFLPHLHALLSAFYFILSLVWVKNALQYPHFNVTLHFIFTFVSLLHAILHALLSLVWISRATSQIQTWTSYDSFISFILYLSFISANILPLFGHGTFQETIFGDDLHDIIFPVILVSVWATIPLNFSNFLLSMSCSIIIFLGIFLFIFQVIKANSSISVYIDAFDPVRDNESYRHQLFLTRDFNSAFIAWGIFFIACFVINDLTPGESVNFHEFFHELPIAVMFLVDCSFFLYRKEYEPAWWHMQIDSNEDPNDNENAGKDNVNFSIMHIMEPKRSEFIYVIQ